MSIKRETTGGTMENITPTVSTTASTSARQGTTMQQQRNPVSHRQGGFTLIELMIVVAIIGILAAIAIPQYQNYVARSQVGRVFSEISALKTAAEERYAQGVASSDASDLGWTASNLLGATTGEGEQQANNPAVNIPANTTADGTITATLNGDVSGAITNTTVTLTRNSTGNGSWTCEFSGDDEYAPAGCPGQSE